jgi:hypothetical protein
VNAVELVSPLSPDECLARLREATKHRSSVVGRVSRRSVRLRMRICVEEYYHTILAGALEEHGQGSMFRGEVGMHPLVAALIAIWFIGAAVVGGVFCIAVIGEMLGIGGVQMRDEIPLPLAAIIPFLILALGIRKLRIVRRQTRDEERILVAFVADAIHSPSLEDPNAEKGPTKAVLDPGDRIAGEPE